MSFHDDMYPFYGLQRRSFIFSGRLLTIILVFVVLASSLLLVLPGIRGKSRLLWIFRNLLSVFVGVVIVALNFTDDWAEATTTSDVTYKSFSAAVVHAEVGLHVGLHGINVTLKGDPVVQLNETIDYNEMFSWQDATSYEDALQKGLPNPVLYLAEKFSPSSPCGLVFRLRRSGRYASASLWTAFCCWTMANILALMPVVLHAGVMMLTTAGLIFCSVISFSSGMTAPRCVFSLGSHALHAHYSHSFWLALTTGLLCSVLGAVMVVMDCLVPEKIHVVFSAASRAERSKLSVS